MVHVAFTAIALNCTDTKLLFAAPVALVSKNIATLYQHILILKSGGYETLLLIEDEQNS